MFAYLFAPLYLILPPALFDQPADVRVISEFAENHDKQAAQIKPGTANPIQETAAVSQPLEAPEDLTGYWKQGKHRILYFRQDGSKLISRHVKRTRVLAYDAEDIDFSATVHGNLVYGAHLNRLSRSMHRKCPVDMWVGIGLTVSEDYTRLTGFRGDRSVNLANCKVTSTNSVPFVYTRMLDSQGQPLR